MEKMRMRGATLPGNSTVEMKEFEIPKPGHGQVLIQTKATTICGSDIRCIYRAHVAPAVLAQAGICRATDREQRMLRAGAIRLASACRSEKKQSM